MIFKKLIKLVKYAWFFRWNLICLVIGTSGIVFGLMKIYIAEDYDYSLIALLGVMLDALIIYASLSRS